MTSISQLEKWWLDPDNQAFFKANKNQDVAKLLFKYQNQEQKRLIIEQIAKRQKIRKKLPQWCENQEVLMPPSLNLEQASSEATARLKATLFSGARLADLTGGFGVDCFYLGQNFKQVHYNEPDAALQELVAYNYKVLDFKATFTGLPAEKLLASLPKQSLIYLDPSRRNAQQQRLISIEDYSPDVRNLEEDLVEKAALTVVKVSPMASIAELLKKLTYVKTVSVISVKNECKEVLLTLSNSYQNLSYKTYNIIDSEGTIQFFEGTPKAAAFEFSEPQDYIFEPNASVLKAGLVNDLSRHFQLPKLHANTQLLTGSVIPEKFPGKVFKVNALHKPFTKSLAKKRYNVIARNFPANASEIEKKLNLKPSNRQYLLAFSSVEGKHFATAEWIKA